MFLQGEDGNVVEEFYLDQQDDDEELEQWDADESDVEVGVVVGGSDHLNSHGDSREPLFRAESSSNAVPPPIRTVHQGWFSS